MSKANNKNGILEGVIWKQLLLFFFPIMIGSFFQQLYNTADALILGREVGKEALAAVGGSASLISSLIVNFFMGLTSGAGIIAAQMLGAGNKEKLMVYNKMDLVEEQPLDLSGCEALYVSAKTGKNMEALTAKILERLG